MAVVRKSLHYHILLHLLQTQGKNMTTLLCWFCDKNCVMFSIGMKILHCTWLIHADMCSPHFFIISSIVCWHLGDAYVMGTIDMCPMNFRQHPLQFWSVCFRLESVFAVMNMSALNLWRHPSQFSSDCFGLWSQIRNYWHVCNEFLPEKTAIYKQLLWCT